MATKKAECPSCKNAVYFNEQVLFAQQPWHKQCLRCMKCKKLLSVDKACDHAGSPYCKTCHQTDFGVRGYSQDASVISRPEGQTVSSSGALDAMVAATGTGKEKEAQTAELFKTGCPKCGKAVFAGERVQGCGRDWHKLHFRCWTCNCLLHAGQYREHAGEGGKTPYCTKCHDKGFGNEGYGRSGSRNVFALTPKSADDVPVAPAAADAAPAAEEKK